MYKLIDGVVLSRVGGENILVATRPVWDRCPNIKSVSPLFAAFWQGISSGMSEEDIILELLKRTKVKEDALRERLDAFLQEMRTDGYLYEEDAL